MNSLVSLLSSPIFLIMRVVKVSGHQLDDAAFLAGFCQAVATFAKTEPVVVINGGGKSIKELQAAFNIPEKKIQGLRVTDAKSLWITEMVMTASVNKLLVRALRQAGLDALGISGVDGGVLTAQKKVLSVKGEVESDPVTGRGYDIRTELPKSWQMRMRMSRPDMIINPVGAIHSHNLLN